MTAGERSLFSPQIPLSLPAELNVKSEIGKKSRFIILRKRIFISISFKHRHDDSLFYKNRRKNSKPKDQNLIEQTNYKSKDLIHIIMNRIKHLYPYIS